MLVAAAERYATIRRFAPAFLDACASWGVTVYDLPTAFWGELVDRIDAGEAAWPSFLRLFVTGGERALPERVARLRRQVGPAVRLANLAAGISVGKVGASVVRETDLLAALTPQHSALRKIVNREEAVEQAERWRHRGCV